VSDPLPNPPAYVLFGVPFHDVTFDEAVAWAVARMKSGQPACIATANVDFLMQAWRDPELQRILLEADLVLADGMPIVWSSGRFGPRLRQRVTGSDLVPKLAAACAREGLRIFLLGGAPGVAVAAAQKLKANHPGLIVSGTFSPPKADILELPHGDILAQLKEAQPHLLLVAFGAPKQEKFINLHVRAWPVPLAIGVGGTLDFLAGAQKRAPVLLQRLGLEWIWRLGTDPGRLFKRYAGNLRFFFRASRKLRAQQRSGRSLRRAPPGAPPPATWGDAVSALPDERSIDDLAAAVRAGPDLPLRVIDLDGRRWLDSRDLGILLALAREARRAGRGIAVWRPAPPVEQHLRTCRLDSYIPICAEQAEVDRQIAQHQAMRRDGVVGTDSQGGLRLWLPVELTAANAAEWRSRVDTNWPTDRRALILIDASGVRFMDSAGVGWLIAVRKRATEEGRLFRTTGFDGPVRKVLKLARVDSFFASS
jgi:N-acetylglucosaminyldiphosphoundecaprenol N-acetyl-beta-D-mannosaminyltransferase